MADFSMSFTIPDDKIADLVDAVDHAQPLMDDQGQPVQRTPAQAKAWFEAYFRNRMRKVFKDYKRFQAAQGTTDLGDT